MPTPTVKLATNIPLVGSVRQAWYAKSKNPEYSDQIKLVGTWDGHGAGSVYLPLPLENDLRALGVIHAEAGAKDRDGFQAYRVVTDKPIRLLKTEEGNRRHTEVTWANGTPPKASQSAFEQVARAVIKAEAGGKKVEWTLEPPEPLAPPESVVAEAPDKNELAWERFRLTYQRIYDIVTGTWPDDTPREVIGTQISTLSISAHQEGLWVNPE